MPAERGGVFVRPFASWIGGPFGAAALGSALLRTLCLLLALVVVLATWEGSIRLGVVPAYLLPPPSSIARAFTDQGSLILVNLMITLAEAGAGLVVAVATILLFSLPLGLWRGARNAILPVMAIIQAIPLIVVAPLIVFWLGTGFATKVVLAALLAFIPISVRTARGMWSLEGQVEQFLYLASGSKWCVFLHGRLPASLPALLDSLRLAIPAALVGALVGEFIGSDGGIGYVVLVALGQLDLPLAFALLIAMSVVSAAAHPVVALLERTFLPWHAHGRT